MAREDNSVCADDTTKAELPRGDGHDAAVDCRACTADVATTFLSGMTGGMILIGVLLTLMPLPSAMCMRSPRWLRTAGAPSVAKPHPLADAARCRAAPVITFARCEAKSID
jgi:hypothetical protein